VAEFRELEAILKKVTDALEELKAEIARAHQVRKDLVHEIKQHRGKIEEQILAEVSKQIEAIRNAVKADMTTSAYSVVDQFAERLRALIGEKG
jgi:gas vesicle protein